MQFYSRGWLLLPCTHLPEVVTALEYFAALLAPARVHGGGRPCPVQRRPLDRPVLTGCLAVAYLLKKQIRKGLGVGYGVQIEAAAVGL